MQPVVLFAEIGSLAEIGRTPQISGGVVNPTVIAAAQDIAMALVLLDDRGRAMAPDSVKGATGAAAIAEREQAISGDLRRDIIARRFQLRLAADPQPFAGEDAMPFLLVGLRRMIPGRRQAEGQRLIVTERCRIDVHGRLDVPGGDASRRR